MSFEKFFAPNEKKEEKPLFRWAFKLFGHKVELKTDRVSKPASLDLDCEKKRIDGGVNRDFATLCVSEFISGLGAVGLKKLGETELAQKIEDEMLERRKKHEFGKTMDEIEKTLHPVVKCVNRRLREFVEEEERKMRDKKQMEQKSKNNGKKEAI